MKGLVVKIRVPGVGPDRNRHPADLVLCPLVTLSNTRLGVLLIVFHFAYFHLIYLCLSYLAVSSSTLTSLTIHYEELQLIDT